MKEPRWNSGNFPTYATVAIAVCVQCCATAMLHFGFTTDHSIELTELGNRLVRPEREIPMFVFGCAVALVVGLAACFVGRWLLSRKQFTQQEEGAFSRTLLFLSIGSFVLYIPLTYDQLFQLSSTSPHYRYDVLPYLFPGALLLIFALAETVLGPTTSSRRSAVAHGILPFLFILLLFPRDWHALSGTNFYIDDMLHHINYFVVNPYINLSHGKTLAAEAYNQYGLGWPTLFGYLLPLAKADYAIFFLVFILATAIYTLSLYGLLRLVTGSVGLAFAGLALWYFVVSLRFGAPLWGAPQTLPVRFIFDAVIMAAMFMRLRTGERKYSFVTALLLGIALFWVTDTGIFIVVAVFATYVLTRIQTIQEGSLDVKGTLKTEFRHVSFFLIPFLLLVFLSVGGAMFSSAFWNGWTGGILDSGTRLGFGSIPFMLTDFGGLTLFCVLMFFYLGPVVRGAYKAFTKNLTARDAFFALVGLYGLELMITFVSRSREADSILKNMHPAIVILLGYYSHWWRMTRASYPSQRRRVFDSLAVGIPAIAFSCAALFVSSDKGIIPTYENLWTSQHVNRNPPAYYVPGKLEMRKVPENERPDMAALTPLFEAMKNYESQSVAVLSPLDGSIYLATGVRPCLDRPFLYSIMTVDHRNQALEQILDEKPVAVIIQSGPLPQLTGFYFDALKDSTTFFQEKLTDTYERKHTHGLYEIWEPKV